MKPESPDLELLRISRASTVSWDFPFIFAPGESKSDATFSGPLARRGGPADGALAEIFPNPRACDRRLGSGPVRSSAD